MELDDMVKYFSNIQIGFFNTKFNYHSESFTTEKTHALYFLVNIKEDGEYYISVHQENARHYKNTKNFQYSPIKMLLARKTGNDYELVQAKHEASSSVFVGELLEAGQYLLYVKINWLFWDQKDFVVSIYGESETKLRIVQKVPDLIARVYTNEAKKNEKRKDYGPSISRCHEIRLDEG